MIVYGHDHGCGQEKGVLQDDEDERYNSMQGRELKPNVLDHMIQF
jgi:hypothetical protein